MDLNLLTIARRAALSSILETSFKDAESKIKQIKNLNDKIYKSNEFTDEDKLQNCGFAIIGLVSVFEHQINEALHQILISYPKKLGGKKFDVEELLEEGSVLELFQKKSKSENFRFSIRKISKFH